MLDAQREALSGMDALFGSDVAVRTAVNAPSTDARWERDSQG